MQFFPTDPGSWVTECAFVIVWLCFQDCAALTFRDCIEMTRKVLIHKHCWSWMKLMYLKLVLLFYLRWHTSSPYTIYMMNGLFLLLSWNKIFGVYLNESRATVKHGWFSSVINTWLVGIIYVMPTFFKTLLQNRTDLSYTYIKFNFKFILQKFMDIPTLSKPSGPFFIWF